MADASIRVLLVDDDEDDYVITRDLIARIKDRRYHLDWLDNYEAALAALQRQQHEVCLLDYRLGGRTGLELLHATRALPHRPPMILLTGQGDHRIDLEAMKAGAADFLIKSQLDPDRLERSIRYGMEGKRAEERLRRERDLISRIMETSPVGIVVTDQTGKITFANHRAEEVLGLSKSAIAAGGCNLLEWESTDLEGQPQPQTRQPLRQVLETGVAVRDLHHAVDGADHQRLLLSTNAAPLYNAAGQIDGLVVTVEDISERVMLETQLRHSQKMESVGQLAAGVAHDINNILTVIQGHTGLLLNTAPPDSDGARSLKQIVAASERAAGFIRQLLTFSRKQIFRSRIFNLNTVLHNLESMLPRMLGEDIRLEMRYDPDLPAIEADPGMIEQIAMNLVVNSRDAMPRGGLLLMATSTRTLGEALARQHPEAHPGRHVCLTVTDTGCGMERKVLERIFEPFFTTKEVGKGTGLGLATIYGIARQHQGWVEVQSQIGVGTTFHVLLPAAEDKLQTVPAPVIQSEAVKGGRETVLVVEDETGLLELVRHVLEDYQYQVLAASSGPEALRLWEEHDGRVDLLFTDMIMPGGMTGGDLAAELKRRKSGLKVIYTSGYSPELLGRKPGQDGSAFLAKPYQPPQLVSLIRDRLDAADNPSRRSPQPAVDPDSECPPTSPVLQASGAQPAFKRRQPGTAGCE